MKSHLPQKVWGFLLFIFPDAAGEKLNGILRTLILLVECGQFEIAFEFQSNDVTRIVDGLIEALKTKSLKVFGLFWEPLADVFGCLSQNDMEGGSLF